MPDSGQDKLKSTNRKERVRITVDVETNGALEKKEPAFVTGVIAALSGDRPESELGDLKRDRKFVDVDRDNIDGVMKDAAPVLNLSVADTLNGGDSKMRVNLAFKGMEDFEPARVAEQIPALKEMLDMRRKLDEVISKINTNHQLNDLLGELLANKEKVEQLAREAGVEKATGSEEK